MLANLRTYLNEGFTYSGLEICEVEGKEIYYLLEISRRKGEFHITNKKTLNDLTELKGGFKKNAPLFLSINTSKVLTKKMEGASGNNSSDALVNHAFPNLDLNNFYYEVVQANNNPIITISKKEYINEILERLAALNVSVFQFSLGVCPLQHILSYLLAEKISISNYDITTSEKRITKITASENTTALEYHINGLDISNKHLLSFAHIIGHISKASGSSNYEPIIKQLKLGFWNQRIFNMITKTSLAFFIVLLLANFFVFDTYHNKVGELNEMIASTGTQKQQVTQLDISVTRKQERVETLSASSNSKSTFYLDEFAKVTPTSILLNEIKYQPLSKPVQEAKPVLLEKNTMLVSGISKSVNDFSFWIEELEKKDWTTSVETLDYDYISNDTSEFLIEIAIDEN